MRRGEEKTFSDNDQLKARSRQRKEQNMNEKETKKKSDFIVQPSSFSFLAICDGFVAKQNLIVIKRR